MVKRTWTTFWNNLTLDRSRPYKVDDLFWCDFGTHPKVQQLEQATFLLTGKPLRGSSSAAGLQLSDSVSADGDRLIMQGGGSARRARQPGVSATAIRLLQGILTIGATIGAIGVISDGSVSTHV